MNYLAVMAALGITLPELLALMKNPEFPRPTSNDGTLADITWSAPAIIAFASVMAAVAANGWHVDYNTSLASTNWTQLAATTPGPFHANTTSIAD